MRRPAFVRLPPRSEAANLALLVLAFAGAFLLLYGAGSALSAYVPWRVPVALPLDARFPFVPAAAGVYLTITLMLAIAPFVLRDLASFLPLFAALLLETASAAVCFLLLPVDAPAIDCCEPGVSGALFRLADALNLERNYLPSLHVAFAFTAAAAYAPRATAAGRVALHLWAVIVAASTLLTRQHFFLDVLTGALLAWMCWRVAGAWARRADVRAAFDRELLCLRNFVMFARRRRRYLFVALAVLAAGVPRWRRARLARCGFAFLQAVDDLLDGDRACAREPLEVVDELVASLESGSFAQDDLARLGVALRAELLERAGPRALTTAIELVRRMQQDRRRVLQATLSSPAELLELHRATFRGSLDLLLIAADSRLRATDVPELIDALGWCSTVRDLDEDLAHGLVNIPAQVVRAARAERPDAPLTGLPATRAVRAWLAHERVRAIDLLDACDARLSALGAQPGARLLRRFAGSVRGYTRPRAYRSASSGATRSVVSSSGAGASGQRTR